MFSIASIDKKQFLDLHKKSNLYGFWSLIFNWGLILIALILFDKFPSIATFFASIIVLGGRQLGLGILMHECAHRSLFKTRKFNDFFGHWVCAAPLLLDLKGYRSYHLRHHEKAGSLEDPDFPSYKPYPVSFYSFLRKILRDITGITGIKTLAIILAMSFGQQTYELSYKGKKKNNLSLRARLILGVHRLKAALMAQLIGVIFLFCLGKFHLFGLWWLSYLTTYMLFARIRNAAEHGAVQNLLDASPLLHTRTTLANWYERLTVAPNHVNYHLEHHLLPNVPHQNLAHLHKRLLGIDEFKEKAEIVMSYRKILSKLTDSESITKD